MRRALGSVWIMPCVVVMASCFGEAPGTVEQDESSDDGSSATTTTTTASTSVGPSSSDSSTSDASTTSSPGETGSTETGVADSSSTGVETSAEPACGDGEVDDGEGCDDANEIDSDGCNANCQVSGRLLWTRVDGDIDDDAGRGIVVAPGGNVFATGRLFVDGIHDDAWVASWDADGTERFAVSIDFGGESYESASDIALTDNGLLVVGRGEVGGWMLQVDADDGTDAPPDGLIGDGDTVFTPVSLARASMGFYVAGFVDDGANQPALVRISDFFAQQWAIHEPQGPAANSQYFGVVTGETDAAFACGISGTEGYVHRREALGGGLEWWAGLHPPIRGISALSTGDLVVVGTSFVQATGDDVWVARLTPNNGGLLWERTLGNVGDEQGIAIAVDAQDHITVGANAPPNAMLLAKYDAAGGLLWTSAVGPDELGGGADVADLAVSPQGEASVVGALFVDGTSDIFVAHFAR